MTITVRLHSGEGDPAETDHLTRQFRQELYELDADVKMLTSQDETPQGAKGDPATVTAIAVTLANSTALVGLCQLARSWVTRGRRRRIMVKDGDRELELIGGNDEQYQQLIDNFLAGRARGPQTEAPPPEST
jgi:hypothetical protein